MLQKDPARQPLLGAGPRGQCPGVSNNSRKEEWVSKINDAVVEAARKGYRVDDNGSVISPRGITRKLATKDRSGHKVSTFTVGFRGGSFPVPVHKLAAYQLYGDKCFEPGMNIRHLNGNSQDNSPKNLALGTGSDNCMDVPEHRRKAHARHASSCRKDKIPESKKQKIRSDRSSGMSYRELHRKHGVSKSTLSIMFSAK